MTDLPEADPIPDREIPIIDAHHHLLDKARPAFAGICNGISRYLLDEFIAGHDGHNIIGSVVVEGHSMYRMDGPKPFRSVGEAEFFNGQAAMAASGLYGNSRAAAGIVARADLTIGDAAGDLLDALIAAAPARIRGIRQGAAWDADPDVVGWLFNNGPGLYAQPDFRAGFRHLGPRGLSFDAFLLAPQLDDVLDLARAFTETQIILCHVGIPIGTASYADKREAMFPAWRKAMTELATCANVAVKLGGLGSYINAFPSYGARPPVPPSTLAQEWGPYLESTIELFGPARCMFESNYPVDASSGSYADIWNAFKLFAVRYTADEKRQLFAGAADRVYRLGLLQD